MNLYNTLTRHVEVFAPLEGNQVRLYTCGPTVYDFAHIGNFRAYVFEDILRRQLKAVGYDVTQVMNITDIDDKTIRGATQQKVALKEYTRQYTQSFFEDLDALAIERAEHYPAATDHVDQMIDLIQRLIDAGYGYVSDDGSVYFNVSKFKNYGRLAHLDLSGLRAGVRVVHDEYDKENVADFALWKAWSDDDGDVAWDTPWGKGRPGWHIECSAMSMTYLGESFDIHTGGVDNMFPHHENEIAQAEAATGKPFVKVWLHCEHLQVEGRKMSKSLGNFYTLRDILDKGYQGREVRYVLLSGHYRQTLNFTFEALDAARTALSRVDEFRERITSLIDGSEAELPAWAAAGQEKFNQAMGNDLGVPEALGALYEIVHQGNCAMDAKTVNGAQAKAVIQVLDDFDKVLGVLQPAKDEVDADVLRWVELRQAARDNKDWSESDRLRDEIQAKGWIVKDTPEGPKVRRKQ